jgi:hypothetical protein
MNMDQEPVQILNSHTDDYIWSRALNPKIELRLPRDFDASRLPENTKAAISSETDSFVAWHLKSADHLFLPNATTVRVARDFKAERPQLNYTPKDEKKPAWELSGSPARDTVGNPALALVPRAVLAS